MRKLIIFLLLVGAIMLFFKILTEAHREGEKFAEKYVEKPINEALKAYQNEAKENLILIAKKEESFFAENGYYSNSLEALNFKAPSRSKYIYTIEKATEKVFVAKASGNIDNDPTIDIWIIREDGIPQNVVDDISN